MMGYVTWSYDILKRFCTDVLKALGFNEKESEEIRDVLLTANLHGNENNGLQRILRYQKEIEKGVICVEAKPEIVCETPISAVFDGHKGMGQLIGIAAMKIAIEKAKTSGIGIVAVRQSNHFGMAGYYTEMASHEGLIGMAFTNAERGLISMFDQESMLNSNPVSIAIPGEEKSFLFDFSATAGIKEKKLKKTDVCHGFVAIDPKTYGDVELLKKYLSEHVEVMKIHTEQDIPVKISTMEAFARLCKSLKLNFFSYFQGYEGGIV